MQYPSPLRLRPEFPCRGSLARRPLAAMLLVAASAAAVLAGSNSRELPCANAMTAGRAIRSKLAKLPLMFEENVGQAASEIKFLSRGSGYSLGLNGVETVLSVKSGAGDHAGKGRATPLGRERAAHVSERVSKVEAKADRSTIRTRLLGANRGARSVGEGRLPARINYLKGHDPKQWRTNVPAYERVRTAGVYSGIDVVYYGQQGGALEYDFVVAPGADPSAIRLAVDGAEEVRLAEDGDLVLTTGEGEVRQRRPVCYQERQGARIPVAGEFVLKTNGDDSAQVAFRLGAYDETRELVIDPVLEYSTLLGSTEGEVALGITTDGSGKAFITGVTQSLAFPTLNEVQTDPLDFDFDAFVSVIDTNIPGGAGLLYSTYLGGDSSDEAYGIATDGAGKVFITGLTASTDFPVLGEIQADPGDGLEDAFLTALDTTQSGAASLLYSTYLGGTDNDHAHGVAWTGAGKVLVGGATASTDFPTLNEFQLDPADATWDGFIAAIDTAVAGPGSLLYSTYLGGNDEDEVFSIATDAAGRAYLTGVAVSDDFPTLNEIQLDPGDSTDDAYVTVLDPTQAGAASLLYSTYLGGSFPDLARNIAADDLGRAFITGFTLSTDFPTVDGYQTEQGDAGQSADAFVSVIDTQGTGPGALLYSTYLGGSDDDDGYGIATDGTGRAFVAGFVSSPDFPLRTPFQSFQGSSDAFVSILDTTLDGDASLLASTCLGGPQPDEAYGIATNGGGKVFVTGDTASGTFPKRNQVQGYRGFYDAFVSVLDLLLPAPTNLTATANGNTSIDLAWVDTTTNETGFELQRMMAGGGWVSSILGADTSSMTDLDVQPSTTYFYRIRAFHDSAEGPWSNVAFDTTAAEPGPTPKAPSGLYATVGAARQLLLQWTDNSDDEDGFRLQRSLDRSTWTQVLDGISNTVGFTDSKLTAGATYYYRVHAYNTNGASGWSEVAAGTPLILPTKPAALRVTAVGRTMLLGWQDKSNNESGFRIERSLVGGAFSLIGTVSANDTSFVDTAVEPETRYLYQVCATNALGNSTYTNNSGVSLPLLPAAPSNLTAVALSNRVVSIAWTDTSNNEAEFRLERRTGSSPYAQIAVIARNGTTFFDSAVAPSTTYVYRIRAANAAGASGYSNQITSATLAWASEGTLKVRPGVIRFPALAVGNSATAKLTLQNTGKGRLQVVVGQLAAPFEVIGNRAVALKPKQVKTLQVRYTADKNSRGAASTLGIAGSGRSNPVVTVSVTAQ